MQFWDGSRAPRAHGKGEEPMWDEHAMEFSQAGLHGKPDVERVDRTRVRERGPGAGQSRRRTEAEVDPPDTSAQSPLSDRSSPLWPLHVGTAGLWRRRQASPQHLRVAVERHDPARTVGLVCVCVAPEWRSQGLARAVVEAARGTPEPAATTWRSRPTAWARAPERRWHASGKAGRGAPATTNGTRRVGTTLLRSTSKCVQHVIDSTLGCPAGDQSCDCQPSRCAHSWP